MVASERLRPCNRVTKDLGAFVVYWMQSYRRLACNHALNHAIEIANQRRLPLLILETLLPEEPWACDRFHSFVIQGTSGRRAESAAAGMGYVFFLPERAGELWPRLDDLARNVACIVTDDFPCQPIPGWIERASRLEVPLIAVDSNGVLPLAAIPGEQYAAFSMRGRVDRLRMDHLQPMRRPPVRVAWPSNLNPHVEHCEVQTDHVSVLLQRCDIDHDVVPVKLQGGETAARRCLRRFIAQRLDGYGERRNDPAVEATSGLSPYLHFGMISALEVALAVRGATAPAADREAFLEQLIVRRELSFNFTRYNPHYAITVGLPAWAARALATHRRDPRPHLYSLEELERAATGDVVWNLVQQEYVSHGEAHGYMRMLWGKSFLQWTPSPEVALARMIHLNNKYALDGRDPNSYAGFAWCLGKHDRPFPGDRAIQGVIRPMSSRALAKRVNLDAYRQRVLGHQT